MKPTREGFYIASKKKLYGRSTKEVVYVISTTDKVYRTGLRSRYLMSEFTFYREVKLS